MTRFAPAPLKRREPKDSPQAVAPVVPAHRVEDPQDRFGAQATFDAGTRGLSSDPWSEMAEIVARLIRAPATDRPAPSIDDAAPLRGTAPPRPMREPARIQDASEPTAGNDPSTVPLDPAKAPSNDPQYALLSGKERPPPGSKIEVPKFPHAKDAGTPGGGTGGGGSPVSSGKARKPTAQTPTGESPGEEEKPEFIVHQWQGAVNSAASGMPREKVAVKGDLAADVDAKKKGAQDRNKKARDGLADDALSNVPKAPEVEDPPAPPPSNPVPEQTERILAASGKRLDDQVPPPLEWSPKVEDKAEALTIEPKQPVIGEQAVPADLFQVLISPQAQEAAALPKNDAKGPDGKRDPEAVKVELALKQLSNTGEVKVPEGEGEQIISKDTGPEPMPPLPPGLEVPVGQVVARLLANADQTSKAVLDGLRTQAYTGGVLKKHFPEIGESMLGDLSQQVNTELRDIAAAANITADQLETMIGERRKDLATSTDQAKKEAETRGTEAVDATRDEGQKTMDAVAGAAKAAEEETLRRQEAAGGASDPTVINRRRDLTVNWITEHVTTQTTNYQLAGEKRTRELGGVRKQQTEAYKALVQRLVYQIMTPDTAAGRKARDTNDAARERHLADLSMGVKTWEDDVLKRVGEMFRKSIKFIEDQTKGNRKAVESAGTAGREAARQWAEDKILEGQSWWKRFIARIQRWLGEADNLNEEWRVRRTRENRDSVAKDLLLIEAAKKKLAEGVKEDAILADKNLTDDQRAIIKQAFRGGNPLEIAAERLKQTITTSHLAAARGIFEKELIAVSPTRDNAEKLNEIVHAMGDTGFDGAKIAQECHAAMDQWGTDEGRIFRNLKGLTGFKGMVVRKYYTAMGFGNLDSDLDSELSGDEYRRAQAQIDGKQAAADAIGLHDAIAGLGTDEKAIMELLRNKTPEEVEAIRAEYQSRYGETLDTALKDDLDEGNEIDQATALMSGDTATADAIALDDAMRGGIVSSGTDEAEIEKVQTRVRDEVLARAKAENWTSQQMEAEVRRRMGAIEKRFGDRYSHVEQYNEPGLTGDSVLKRAFASELSGSELDLANALQDNDLIKADAARIEIERTGFYASDDKLLKVMRSQYERALEARRLDEGPARQMRVRREVDKWRDQVPQLSEEEISRKRMAMERQMEKEIDAGATKDAKVSTEALRGAYEGKYNRNLAYTLSFNMSGREHDTALALLKNGGKLSPLQEIELATRGDGTEEDVLKKTFKTMTKDEIKEVRRQWEARHPGKSFDEMIRGELSGRDESDIMDMVEHGAPESAKEQIAQEVRRVKREREDLTGIVGRSAAGSEDEWMQFQVKRLQELETDLDRKDWPPGPEGKRQREELMGKVEFRVQRVQDSVEDHRRKIDSVTDSISQVASIVAAVVVGAIVTVLTAGTMGPAAIAAVVALASSMAATMTTMATKRLVMGGAYGAEDFAVDLAVGVVDAVVSVATAGMGDKLLKVAKGVAGKLPVARIGGMVAKPMATLGTKVAASPLSRVATGIAESGLATKAMKTPFVGGALKSAGSSARQFGKVLTNPLEMEGAAARFLARSGENVLQSMPATMTQLGLSDDTWKGDPFANFVSGMGSGAWQAFYMGHLLAGPMEHASNSLTHGFGHIQTNIQMKTELGKLQVAGRLVQEGYSQFHAENPGASIGDFLAHPDGRKLRAEIEAKGLLPTVESVNKKVAADPAVKARMEADGPGGPASAKAQSDLRAAQLEAALPGPLRDKALVSPDPTLTGNTVRVEPLRIGDRIVGVEVRVGPDATPLDVAMHAATVHAMQKYTGLAGQIRQSFENFAHWAGGSEVRIGKRGWEARLEMGKLPAIIDARLKALEGEMVTPDLAKRLQADIDSLTQQFHEHQAIFHDDALGGMEGRGYVAAEDAAEHDVLLSRIEGADDLRELRDRMLDRATASLQERANGRAESADQLLIEAQSIGGELAKKLGISIDGLRAAFRREAQRLRDRSDSPLGPAEVEALAQERLAAGERKRADERAWVEKNNAELARIAKEKAILSSIADQIETDRAAPPKPGTESIESGEPTSDFGNQLLNERIDQIIHKGRSDRGVIPDSGPDDYKPSEIPAAIATLRDENYKLGRTAKKDFGKKIENSLKIQDTVQRNQAIDDIRNQLNQALRSKGLHLDTPDLDAAIAWLGRESRSGYLKGRRPQAKAEVDKLRRPQDADDLPPELAGKISSMVLDSALAANAAAMARIKSSLATNPPDTVFGVREGGAFFLEAVMPRPGDPHQHAETGYQITAKETSKPHRGTPLERTLHLERAIEEAITRHGQRRFATIDSYMGGTAAPDFIEMIDRIVARHPKLDLKFELIWIREGVGFESNIFIGKGRPEHDWQWWHQATPIPAHLATKITMTFEHVRFVVGDDMKPAYLPDAKSPVIIFNRHGDIVAIIEVGTIDPQTGDTMNSTREIMIALINGARFWP